MPSDVAASEPVYAGLTLSAWLKIGIVAVLMAATFWIDLRHLYLKTNPFTGEANWGHSVCIPLIGLYYLYLNREALLSARAKPMLAEGFDRLRLMVKCRHDAGVDRTFLCRAAGFCRRDVDLDLAVVGGEAVVDAGNDR